MRLLPLLLLSFSFPLPAAEPPVFPAPGGTFSLDVTLKGETRGGKTIVLASGRTDLPDGTILRGTLHYRIGDRLIELVSLRKDLVTNGSYAMPLDGGFGDTLFPGRYEATLAPDTLASQPADLQARLGRKARLLKWTGTLLVGEPGAERDAELRLRAFWRKALQNLLPIAEELATAFDQHAARPAFDAAAWTGWKSAWVARVLGETSAPANNALALILPSLHPDWTVRGVNPPWAICGHAVHELMEAASTGELVLRASPRDASAVLRVRRTIEYHRQQIALLQSSLPLLRPDPSETQGLVGELRQDILELKAQLKSAKEGTPGRAAEDWASWSGAWRARLGTRLLRLAEGRPRPELAQAIQEFAASIQMLEESAGLALAGGNTASPPDPLIDAALAALDAVKDALPKE